MSTRPPRRLGLLTAALTTSLLALGVGSPAAQAATSSPEISGSDVTDYVESTMPGLLTDHGVPGAAVSVVSGGQTVFSGGYGVADLESGTPVDAAGTLFRIGSVTKLFTTTAVMQQVEAGNLDLDTDVNEYLTDFQIPDTFDQPITLRNLLTHTAGFEDVSIGTYARTPEDVQPLGEYLAAHMPARIRPPGQISGYSNYGAGLAGYLVSQVSGQSYQDYLQEHVLDELGMTHSSIASEFPAEVATSYDGSTDPASPVARMYDQTVPDGGLNASADDMAQFMIAQLGDGSTDTGRVLAPETVDLIHQQAFTAADGLPGMALGFMEDEYNGHAALEHDGGEEAFVSMLVLIPDLDLGVFVSFNAYEGAEAAGDFLDGFMDRFVPEQESQPAASTAVGSLTEADAPTPGFYISTRHNESAAEKITSLFASSRLKVADDGTLTFQSTEWTVQPDGSYRNEAGTRLALLTDDAGQQYLTTGRTTAYQLVPSSETVPGSFPVFAAMLLPLLGLLVLPLTALIRRLRHRSAPQLTARWRLARALGITGATLGVVFLVAMIAILMGDTQSFYYGPPATFLALLAVPLIALACGVAAAVLTVTSWRGAGAGVVVRIHQISLFVSLIAFTWFASTWNLLGWQFV